MIRKSSSGYGLMREFEALPVFRTPRTSLPGPTRRASPPTSIPFRLRFSPIKPSGSIGRKNSGLSSVFTREKGAARGRT